MPFQVSGPSSNIAEISTAHKALRVEQRPLDHGTLGAYRKSMLSGTMAGSLAANSEIYQFRWSDATRLCSIHSVYLDGIVGGATVFTPGFVDIELVPARAFTADGTGGATGTTSGNNGKVRTSMGTSLITTASSIRCATTAALGIGTKVLDTDAIGQLALSFGATANVQYAGRVALFGEDPGNDHPLILATNEGFMIRATVPALGTWQFGVTVDWTELAAY